MRWRNEADRYKWRCTECGAAIEKCDCIVAAAREALHALEE